MWIHLLTLGLIDGASAVQAAVEEVVLRGGSSKRRGRVIRFSDFETRDQYERELRIAAMPLLEKPIPFSEIPDDDEDEMIFKLLVMLNDD